MSAKKLTVTLTLEEMQEAVKQYVEKMEGEKVQEVLITSDGFKMVHCVVDCETDRNKQG